MESLYWLLIATISISLLIFKLLNYPHVIRKLPPGPSPWPLIGNLNLIGPLPHQSLHKLSQTYGELMYLKFGSTPVVVASSPEMAKLLLRTHDHVFASRPSTAAGRLTHFNCRSVGFSPYGPYWIQGRKIYYNEVFSAKKLSFFEYIRVEECKILRSRLHALSGEPIMLKGHLSRCTLSVISRMVLGRKYISESEGEKEVVTFVEFREMLDEFFVLNGTLNIGDWIPWMQFMDLQGYVKRMKTLRKRLDRFLEHVLEDHRERMRDEGDDFVVKDVVDSLLKMVDDPNLEVKIDFNDVKGLTQDLVAGGTETSALTVEWAMSELIKQPHLIKKAIEELDIVIGTERWVEENDLPNLPFLDSILKETMRLHPVAILPPHLSIQDCKVAGYDIAKGTLIFTNSWSIGRDPNFWDDPESFRPERFFGRDIDVKGQHFELLPFGSGRRMCPGYNFALLMTSSLLANMLQGFTWKLPKNMRCEDINMDEVYGLSTTRKFPLYIIPEPRLLGKMYH
ncbi:hypothetical protein OSB04_015023 [Centaurea solstitialis]|uniref:Cytochrome P450 n=1 Tax=Centaurea solstitialis TaxID=347529 RepID=A0AA38SYD2_9ASTR|nr:hypothetical protein OSB04_015023 [Centaurea solstitialis]